MSLHLVFDASPTCGICYACKQREYTERRVREILAEFEPQIDRARDDWHDGNDFERALRARQLHLYNDTDRHRLGKAEERTEVARLALLKLERERDDALAPFMQNTLTTCAVVQLRPRMTWDCNE